MRKVKAMTERFTRWGLRKSAEAATRLHPQAISFTASHANIAPSLPGLQLRRFSAAIESPSAGNPGRMISGVAVPYNLKIDMDAFRETYAFGCFRESIARDAVVALFNSDLSCLLGRNSSGSLDLWESAGGLNFAIHAADTSWGNDVLALIGRGDIDEAGASFWIQGHHDEYDADGLVRVVTKARLVAVGPVTFGLMVGANIDAAEQVAAARAAGVREGRRQAAADFETGRSVGMRQGPEASTARRHAVRMMAGAGLQTARGFENYHV